MFLLFYRVSHFVIKLCSSYVFVQRVLAEARVLWHRVGHCRNGEVRACGFVVRTRGEGSIMAWLLVDALERAED